MKEAEDKIVLEDETVLKVGNFNFYLCLHGKPLEMEKAIIYDAIVIEAGDQPHTLNLVRKIRSHLNPECYLKPIFLFLANQFL